MVFPPHAKGIFWYLKETISLSLCYHGDNLRFIGYSDGDKSTNKDEMKSISRYVFIIGGGAFQDVLKIIFVSPYLWWSQNTLLAQLLSKRQSSLDDSYRAWMLRYIQMILSLFIVANTSEIAYTKDSKYYGKSKYIDTKYHFIWDIIVQV